jgi:hypothetical protein
MKTNLFKISYATLLLSTALLCSCDNFLDIQPKGRVIITTAQDYREMLTQAYSIVPEDRGLTTFRGDEFVMDATLSKEDISNFRDIWCWNDVSPDDATTTFNWRNYYQVIYEANHTIENKANITEGTTAEVNQLVGESYMLRAYMHFLLVNLFGEPYTAVADPYSSKAIPLKLTTDSYEILTRNTVGEVYDQILSDISEAEKYLNVETWETGKNYRFNTLSVDALRSRVYLYMGKWSDCLAASQRVLAKKNALSDLNSELPNAYNSVENIVALEQVMTADYIDAGKVSKDLWNSYNSNDLRRAKYFKQVTASNILAIKGGNNKYSCSFRTGEIYLNAAEAALEASADNMEVARQYLLTLMKSRYKDAYYQQRAAEVNAMSRDELRNEIYAERRRELAFEGHRWFDLRRTTRPQLIKTYGGVTYTLEQNDSRYTLRIPSAAISANPELAK